jgi:hypothetical protein
MPGERELLEELLHAIGVLALVRIDLGVCALEIRRSEHSRGAMSRARDEHHVEVVSQNQPIQMHPDKRQRRAGAPVAEQPVFHVFCRQRFAEQGVVFEIDHPHRKVVAGTPVGVHLFQLCLGQGAGFELLIRDSSFHVFLSAVGGERQREKHH